jgi:hypothetical protein
LVFISAIQPSESRGKDFFYDRIIPFLTSIPLLSAWHLAPEENSNYTVTPLSGDSSLIHCVLEAIVCIGRVSGFSTQQSTYFKYSICNSLFNIVRNDIKVIQSISTGEIDLLRIAVNTMAIEAGNQAFEGSLATHTELINSKFCLDDIKNRINHLDEQRLAPPPLCQLNYSVAAKSSVCNWSLFGRFCKDVTLDHLIGDAPTPAICRPVELTKLMDRVSNFMDVTNAMRNTLNLCILLSNQKSLIKNSYTLRICLIKHLFIRVLPIPLPINHPERDTKCFWHSQAMRHETQFDILRLLNMICRHFTAASLSVKYTRTGDAVRILTISCMAAICDATLRKIASDIPSPVSLHYSGLAPGPVKPYGFDMGNFAIESEYLQFNTPETSAARTQVLDYFFQLKQVIAKDHVIFRFDKSNECGAADKQFIRQICLQNGFDTGNEELYITGENCEILDNYPEIGYVRDLIFTFKLIMVPSSDSLPEVRLWNPADASLKWSSKNGVMFVQGFNRRLECIYPDIEIELDSAFPSQANRGLFSRLWRFLGLTAKPRASPSSANPSVLAGERVDTEDDVLHLKTLPNFEDTMGARDSEVMLQYLTAPYLRIPLLLNFFSNEKRLKSLRSFEMQQVLDAALFEPGRWQEEYEKAAPTQIPAPTRNHLSTPVGLLFNEIIMSPNIILSSIKAMLERVVDMDSGRFSEISESILYVLRLAVRIEGYLLFLIKNHNFHKLQNEAITRGEKTVFQGAYTEAAVRGLQCSDETIEEALNCRTEMRSFMDTKLFKIVARWIKRAKMEGKMMLACKLHAHLAFIYRNIEVSELNAKNVFAQFASQIFLANNFKYDLEFGEEVPSGSGGFFSRKANDENITEDLGIPQIELYDMFQRNRRRIMDWLTSHPTHANEV